MSSTTIPTTARPDELGAFTIPEFCHFYRISVPLLYKKFARGEGPDTFYVGSRRLISREAANRWCRAREAAAKELA